MRLFCLCQSIDQSRDLKPRNVDREEVGEMEAQIEKLTADGAAASEGKTAAEAALALVKEEKAEADDYLAEFEAMSIQETEKLTQEKEELSGNNADLQAKIDELTAALEKCKKDLEKTKKQKRAAAKAAAEAAEAMNDLVGEANQDRGAEARLGEEVRNYSHSVAQTSNIFHTNFAQNDRLKAILGEDGEEKLSVYEQISEALDDYGIECEMSEVPEKLGELVRLQITLVPLGFAS